MLMPENIFTFKALCVCLDLHLYNTVYMYVLSAGVGMYMYVLGAGV